jgi:hypothetical protein
MARKCGPRPRRLALALISWIAAASVAHALLGAEIDAAARPSEERIELQLRRGTRSGPGAEPTRPQEDDRLEPWELVGV